VELRLGAGSYLWSCLIVSLEALFAKLLSVVSKQQWLGNMRSINATPVRKVNIFSCFKKSD
jgi:hypothetical protein